jgi:hypothetical protein
MYLFFDGKLDDKFDYFTTNFSAASAVGANFDDAMAVYPDSHSVHILSNYIYKVDPAQRMPIASDL